MCFILKLRFNSKTDRIYPNTTLFKYINIIRNSKENSKPFDGKLHNYLLRDWNISLEDLFQKISKLENTKFTIQEFVKFKYL